MANVSDHDGDESTQPENSPPSLPWTTPRDFNLASLSDSDDDDGVLRRTGAIPHEWYNDMDHIGYNVDGIPITRAVAAGAIDTFLSQQTAQGRRTVYDAENDANVVLSKSEISMLRRIRDGCYATAGFDESAPEYFRDCPRQVHPLGNHTTPNKSSFTPSKHQAVVVQRLVTAIRNGWIRDDSSKSAKAQPEAFLIWGPDSVPDPNASSRHRPPPCVTAPRAALPGHAESYNPPAEYLPDEEERHKWDEMDAEDQHGKILSVKYDAHRHIPYYDRFIQERFERCLDLYMCPRRRRNKLQIDPESLIPKLPKPSTLRPFPQILGTSYFGGHTQCITSLSVSSCGQYLASGSADMTACVWEVDTCRRLQTIQCTEPLICVAFNPSATRRGLLAIATLSSIRVCNIIDTVDGEVAKLLSMGVDSSATTDCPASWTVADQSVTVSVPGAIKKFMWHRAGDYMVSLSDADSQAILIHQLSVRGSQAPFKKAKKSPAQDVAFHPTRPYLIVAEKRRVRIFDLQKQSLVKRLQCPARWISSVTIHPSGDHVIVGSADRRVCWYDLDLSSRPFRTLKYHTGAVRHVQCHPRYPLFATCSDDGSAHVMHGSVSSDLLVDPVIVPVKVLRAHTPDDGIGVTCCVWHPDQPWLFTTGADLRINMFVP